MNKQDKLQAQRNELFDHSTDTLARIKELDVEIQAVIDKKAVPEVTHSVGDRYEDADGTKFILARIKAPDVSLVQLDNGDLRGSPSKVVHNSKITVSEFKELCCGLELTLYYDARKQTKVGEKAEVKDEPKLRHGDYGISTYAWIFLFGKLLWIGDHLNRPVESSCDQGCIAESRRGNLIDDLTETSDGFEMEKSGCDLDVTILPSGSVCIKEKQTGDDIFLEPKELAEFHRKLGHVLNGIIRSKNHG